MTFVQIRDALCKAIWANWTGSLTKKRKNVKILVKMLIVKQYINELVVGLVDPGWANLAVIAPE